MAERIRQCPAGVILWQGGMETEYRCALNIGHEGAHMESEVAWSTYE